jgi:hypothetical protein
MEKVLDRQLLLVEFLGEYPHNVQVMELSESHGYGAPARRSWTLRIYDAAYSKRERRVLYHCSGSGGLGGTEAPEVYVEHADSHWLAPHAVLTNPMGRRIEQLSDELRQQILCGMDDEVNDIVCCSICDDYYDGSDDYKLCPHIWWCDKCGDLAGPGACDGVVDCRHFVIEPWDDDDLDEDLEIDVR